MPPVDLIIFDCDGVLVDSEPVFYRTLSHYLTENGGALSAEECEIRFIGLSVQAMGARPPNTVVIEDSPAGVQAGVAAGMTVVGFTGGGHILPGHGEHLRALGAHHIIDDMRGLPNLLH